MFFRRFFQCVIIRPILPSVGLIVYNADLLARRSENSIRIFCKIEKSHFLYSQNLIKNRARTSKGNAIKHSSECIEEFVISFPKFEFIPQYRKSLDDILN